MIAGKKMICQNQPPLREQTFSSASSRHFLSSGKDFD